MKKNENSPNTEARGIHKNRQRLQFTLLSSFIPDDKASWYSEQHNKSNHLLKTIKNVFIKYQELILFILTLIIYVANLSPSIYGGDSGDIATAAITYGVPHPSGYPLQTMLGILFLKLPIQATPAWKIGLVSALFSSLTLVVIYKTVLILTKRRDLGVLTSLSIAFTYSFWLYAEVVEVFALNSFFISLLIFLTIRYHLNKNKKDLFLLALSIGLSLTNNQSIILLFPFIGLSVLFTNWRAITNYKTVLKCIGLFLFGLTPYIYIPIAATRNPVMNWGFAQNWENFWYLVTRQYYGWGDGLNTVKMHYTVENIISRMGVYTDYWKSYIHPLVPVLIFFGAIEILRKRKFHLFALLFLLFLLVGPLFMIFAGSDFKSYLALATIERFFLSNILISFLFLPFGVVLIENVISQSKKVRPQIKSLLSKIFIIVLFLIPAVTFLTNFERTNFSDVYIGDNLAVDILSSLPPDSVLMLRNDTVAFNTIYYQEAYNFRKDIQIPGMHNGFITNLKATGMNDEEIGKHILINKGGITKDIFENSIKALLDNEVNVFVDGIYSINLNSSGDKIVTVPLGLLYKFEYYRDLPYPKRVYLDTVNMITDSYHTTDFEKRFNVMENSLTYSDIKKIYSADYYRISEHVSNQYREGEEALKFLIKSIKLDPFAEYDSLK